MRPIAIIIGCWIIFEVYWLASAHGLKLTVERQSWRSLVAQRLPVLLGVLLISLPVVPYPLSQAFLREPWAAAAGVVLCVLGLCIAVWARHRLAGNWSALVTLKKDHELIESGPYRFVRHPIYTGILAMLLGTAVVMGRLGGWMGFLCVTLGFWMKLKHEEALMLRHFPDKYPAYQTRVKALVPFVI
jgi:protein-S-isoprenylcysteine O-methyltransferase Ste14